jgi:hypothetical protein
MPNPEPIKNRGSEMLDGAITPDRLFSIGSGYRRAKTLLSAVELHVFTVLAGNPQTAVESTGTGSGKMLRQLSPAADMPWYTL